MKILIENMEDIMSGPKSSTYQVDPQVLRERMLEAEHQRNMSNIKKEACRDSHDPCTPTIT